MNHFPKDIYTEPTPDVNTLANLGPLTGMAGIWVGEPTPNPTALAAARK